MKKFIQFLAVILFLILIFVLFSVFYDTIKEVCFFFVANFGIIGIFLLAMFMDTLFVPLSPSIFVFAGTFGGANLWLVTFAGALGSCVAGVFGYTLGYKIGRKGLKKIVGQKHLSEGKKFFNKYGIWGVIIGAATPVIPYSLMNWTSGIYHMRFSLFASLIFSCRIFKFFLVAFLGTIV